MIFVNDLGPGAPSWMHHIRPSRADGMTLADVVFPAFLFIVGVSIPLAFERAREVGKSIRAQFGHILLRTAGLLFMGVIVYNSEDSHTKGQPLWGLLAFIALIMAWCSVPRERTAKRNVLIAVKALGIVGLWSCWRSIVASRRPPRSRSTAGYRAGSGCERAGGESWG